MSDKNFKVKNGADVGGTVTATAFVGDGSGLTGISSYTAPTLGSTSIASGATVSTIAGLTLTNPALQSPAYTASTNIFVAGSSYSTDGTTWTANGAPSNLGSIIRFGNSLFVTVTSSGTGATSTNGITWTNRTIRSGVFFQGLAFGNNVWFASNGPSNSSSRSTDGITWTDVTGPTPFGSNSVAFGAGIFFALKNSAFGNEGFSSTDAITWTSRTMPTTYYEVVEFLNNRFIALGRDNTSAAYSTNGITWSQATMPSSAIWSYVTYGNGIFLAVPGGFSATTAAASSTDGITWTARTLPVSSTWRGTSFNNGVFVAISSTTSAYTSTDAITWTLRTLPTSGRVLASGTGAIPFPATSGTLSINGSTGTNGQILSSTGTGLTWTNAPTFHPVFAMV